MTIRTTNTGAAVVNTQTRWIPIDETTPRGTKLQLINKEARVAVYGLLGTHEGFFTHWHPLPVFDDVEEQEAAEA